MSLTSELADPASVISRFFAANLPDADSLAARLVRWTGHLRRPVRPPTRGEVPWAILGHTIDHRMRVTLGDPYGTPIKLGVADVLQPWNAAESEGTRAAVHAAGTELLAELSTHARPPFVLAGPEGERLIRLCFTASYFERIFREGTVLGPLLQADPGTTLQDLLDRVPDFALADIGAQLRLAAEDEALGWTLGRAGANGPVFDGSVDVGGADADFVYDGDLIDCKCTVRPDRLGVRELHQLAGYLLLDYSDTFAIRQVGLYLSRQGAWIGWGVEEFLTCLGATAPLDRLRVQLADALGSKHSTAGRRIGGPRRPAPGVVLDASNSGD
ncbi:hypothetical protein AB0I39_27270 [Kitasatospora purpeofusca]|uniref:hypothetical protein n=1 Tax=Kitasatospora purpeofusca TaxID=67352 RepID=UPI0033FCEA3B